MENQSQYQYKYDDNTDVLLKSHNGHRWFYTVNLNINEPVYTEYEKELLESERVAYQEAQETWAQQYIEMVESPDYWENYLQQHAEIMSDNEKEIVSDMIIDTSRTEEVTADNTIKLSFDDQYSKVYGKQYTDKMNYLVDVVMNYETGTDEFNVLNFEAGLGKSFTVDRLLLELTNYHWEIKKKFLIVKRFNDESDKSVKFIHSEFLRDIAVAITHENWGKWLSDKDELMDKKIIFISHQRYIKLCENDEHRQIFTGGRDTLIIDEKINFPVFTYNEKRYNSIHNILPFELKEGFLKVCKPLNKFISLEDSIQNTNKVLTKTFKINPATLRNFMEKVTLSIHNKTIKFKLADDRNKLNNFIKELPYFYTSQCFYNSGNISTYNPLHKHWGLNNNIILDASGGIDGVYQVNANKYRIIPQSRIVDHGDCKFNVIKFNSSKSKVKENSVKYFAELTTRILEGKECNDKILIVGHKGFAETIHNELLKLETNVNDIWIDKRDKANDPDYDNQSIAISWYGNLIGKNWAKDFTQVWLISTPNIPLEHYLIHFLQYSDDKIGNKSTVVYKGRYKNKQFNTIQKGYIAAEMYQSLKRIQRVAIPKGTFNIVCNDDEVVSMILSQMKNSNVINPLELDFVKEEQEAKEVNNKPNQVDKFIEYIMTNKSDTYKKKDIADELQIKKLNRVLTDEKVKSLLSERLMINNRTIQIL